jgi:hypothetical protein
MKGTKKPQFTSSNYPSSKSLQTDLSVEQLRAEIRYTKYLIRESQTIYYVSDAIAHVDAFLQLSLRSGLNRTLLVEELRDLRRELDVIYDAFAVSSDNSLLGK